MSKLLSANFSRLWKSRVFWLGMLAMMGLGVCVIVARYLDVLEDPSYAYTTADGLWFLGGLCIPLALSVVISFWIGADYHDGTLRNKLVVGHGRWAIYAANWVTCVAASLLMHICYILVVAVLGTLLLEPFSTPIAMLAALTLVSFLSVVAMASLFTMVAMLVGSKSICAVVSMLTALALVFGSMTVISMLSAPEYHDNNYYMTSDGEMVQGDPIPNPRYLRGAERDVYQFVLDFQPAGQMVSLLMEEDCPDNVERFPFYSMLLTVITTCVGYALFRKTDVK